MAVTEAAEEIKCKISILKERIGAVEMTTRQNFRDM